jgi:hypothetical protein
LIATSAVVPSTLAAMPQDTIHKRVDTATAAWGQNVPLVAELSIGQLKGPPEYVLGSVGMVAVRRSGAFVTFDARDSQIRRYDARGVFLGTAGRSGNGPGEFEQVGGMAFHGDSLLVIFDPGNARISFFDLAGKFRRSTNLARAGFFLGRFNFQVDTAGLISLVVAVPGGPVEGPGSRAQWIRFRADGRMLDSILIPSEGPQAPSTFAVSTSDGTLDPFFAAPFAALTPVGGLVWGNSGTFRFAVKPPKGPVMVVERNWRPVPLEGKEFAEWTAFAEYFAARAPARHAFVLPKTKPAYRELRADNEGRIWVSVYARAEKRHVPPRPAGNSRPLLTWKQRTTFDVFSAIGQYLGRIQLPPESQLMAIRGSRIWVLGKGPSDEQRIVVYRLPTPKVQ